MSDEEAAAGGSTCHHWRDYNVTHKPTTRAKMTLASIKKTAYGQTLGFHSQYDDTIPEDQKFQLATPSASAEFMIDNPAALARRLQTQGRRQRSFFDRFLRPADDGFGG
jgi:hypothetical protein